MDGNNCGNIAEAASELLARALPDLNSNLQLSFIGDLAALLYQDNEEADLRREEAEADRQEAEADRCREEAKDSSEADSDSDPQDEVQERLVRRKRARGSPDNERAAKMSKQNDIC